MVTCTTTGPQSLQAEHSPIRTYHSTYNEFFSNNRLIDTNLVMTPAEHTYEKEDFAVILVPGVINLTPQKSKADIRLEARNQALKTLLKTRGLKFISAINKKTTVSYKGTVNTPVKISAGPWTKPTCFAYTATVEFRPKPFPEAPSSSNIKSYLKDILDEFISFFD